MIVESTNFRDDLVQQASQVFAHGKGHLGVINMLTTMGFSNDEAKAVSYEIFDDAKLHLRRSQLHIRCVAWGLILIGVLLSLVPGIIYRGFELRTLAISFILAFIGIRTLSKLPNPSRLPNNQTNQDKHLQSS